MRLEGRKTIAQGWRNWLRASLQKKLGVKITDHVFDIEATCLAFLVEASEAAPHKEYQFDVHCRRLARIAFLKEMNRMRKRIAEKRDGLGNAPYR